MAKKIFYLEIKSEISKLDLKEQTNMEVNKMESKGDKEMTLSMFPDHILELIFSFLPLEDIAHSISRVSRQFRSIGYDSIRTINECTYMGIKLAEIMLIL